MPQFLIERDAVVDGRVSLRGVEAHHVRHVLRYKTGDSIQLFDGKGRGFEGRIVGMASGEIKILIVRERSRGSKSPLVISLLPALLPYQVMDEVIRQATELGVAEIGPILCQRCVVRLDEKGVKMKHRHWERVALSASKQCGRLQLPRVHEAVKLGQWLDHFRLAEAIWVAHPCPGVPSVCQRMKEILRPGKRVHLLIGPEGGFTEAEIEAIRAKGGKEIHLGDLTLRSPTASLYVLSILSYLYQNS